MKAGEIEALRKRFKALYPNEPTQEWQPLTDRIRRALSWLEKASTSKVDSPIRFVELWIALNALYGQQPPAARTRLRLSEEAAFAKWAETVAGLDSNGALIAFLDDPDVDSLLRNRFLCSDYWEGNSSYQSSINNDVRKKREAIRDRRMADALVCVFQRILVLRNQIVHGSAAQNTQRNQDAVQPAIRVLSAMLHVAVVLMIEKGSARCMLTHTNQRCGGPARLAITTPFRMGVAPRRCPKASKSANP